MVFGLKIPMLRKRLGNALLNDCEPEEEMIWFSSAMNAGLYTPSQNLKSFRWIVNSVDLLLRNENVGIQHTYITKNGYKNDTLTPTKAIRQKCLECSNWQPMEVKVCSADDCAIGPFRMGKNPARKGLGGNPNMGHLHENH